MTAKPVSLSKVVSEADTAASYGSPFPAAAATPFVLGLAEVACHKVIQDELEPGQITVGVRAVIEHGAPTPVGGRLTATASEVARAGRRISFRVEVVDDAGPCATVEHERAIVDLAAIEERLATRLEGTPS